MCQIDEKGNPPGQIGGEAASSDISAPLLSLVIPVYNEGDQVIDACLREVRKVLEEFGKPWEIIFIDDFSTDGSLQQLLGFLEVDPRIRVVSHSRNLGAVKAILSGLRVSRGEIVIPFDPDLQFAPECIPQLAQQVMDGYDFAGGVRVNRRDSLSKRLSSWAGSMVISSIMGVTQRDFGSIKAYSRRIVDGILSLPQDYIAIQAAAFSLSKNFIEIPIKHQKRATGESKWTFFMRLEYFSDVFTSYSRYPFSTTLLVGGLMHLAGIGLGVAGMAYWLLVAGSIDLAFWVFALWSFTICVSGGLFMAVAVVGKFAVRGFRRKFQLGDEVFARVHYRPDKSKPDGYTKTGASPGIQDLS
jgi:undecaprenyl-phosphate 4-deoxy-4-formamido-L-arabinose transferase